MTTGKDWTMENESKEAREPGYEHVCVIADRGWVFEGYRAPGAGMRLIDAHVVRRWDNGLGLGAIADPSHRRDYVLEDMGTVEVYESAVIAVIDLRW